ncbi:MAG: leucine-rich repeat domain-containing protein [Anaerolineae bacterium]|nr:leucine-rich repeat domain-containing protein [Anaerolineae bacterium]
MSAQNSHYLPLKQAEYHAGLLPRTALTMTRELCLLFVVVLVTSSCALMGTEAVAETSSPPTPTSEPTTPDERGALVALYRSSGGDQWSRRSNWLGDQLYCKWEGVTCQGLSIVELNLFGNKMKGTVPPEIRYLKDLKVLNLGGNQLTELPPDIGELVNLQQLDMSGNLLTEVPPELGQLTELQKLDLRGNQLTNLPGELSRLTGLRQLYLASNQYIEVPPEICRIGGLRVTPSELCH